MLSAVYITSDQTQTLGILLQPSSPAGGGGGGDGVIGDNKSNDIIYTVFSPLANYS